MPERRMPLRLTWSGHPAAQPAGPLLEEGSSSPAFTILELGQLGGVLMLEGGPAGVRQSLTLRRGNRQSLVLSMESVGGNQCP